MAIPVRIATTRAVDDDCVITRLEKATMIATIHNEPEFSELFMSYLLTRISRIEEDDRSVVQFERSAVDHQIVDFDRPLHAAKRRRNFRRHNQSCDRWL